MNRPCLSEAEQLSFCQSRSDVSGECVIHGQEEGLDWVGPFFYPALLLPTLLERRSTTDGIQALWCVRFAAS